MSWGHIVIEGYCNFCEDISTVPRCCKYKPGIVGPYCLIYDGEKHVYCPYLGFTKARSSVVLTNENGDAVASEIFYNDEIIDEKNWLKAEQQWIKKWKHKLENKI